LGMRKRGQKSAGIESETAGGGIAAAIAQDIELTAEQIKEAAEKAVVAVEKIAGLKPAGARKAKKKVVRKRPRVKAAPSKSARATKAKTKKKS
jgi:hypothetical protein